MNVDTTARLSGQSKKLFSDRIAELKPIILYDEHSGNAYLLVKGLSELNEARQWDIFTDRNRYYFNSLQNIGLIDNPLKFTTLHIEGTAIPAINIAHNVKTSGTFPLDEIQSIAEKMKRYKIDDPFRMILVNLDAATMNASESGLLEQIQIYHEFGNFAGAAR